MHFRTHKLILNNKKIRFFSKNFQIFLCPAHLIFFFNFFFQKKVVHYTFYMILSRFEQKKFFRFFEKISDPIPSTLAHSGSHTVRPIDISFQLEYLYLQINNFAKGFLRCPASLDAVIVQSCRYLAETRFLRFGAIFGRGPYVQLFEFQFLNYPKPHSLL